MSGSAPSSGGPGPVAWVDEELQPLVGPFLERRRAELEVLLSAAEAGDLERLRALGHALRGTAGGYGFDDLTDLGAVLEIRAKEGDLSGARASVNDIVQYVRTVRVEYR